MCIGDCAHAAAFFDVQHTDGLVVRGADDVLERRMEQHRAHPVLVRREGLQTHAFQRVPELYAAVPRAGHQITVLILCIRSINIKSKIRKLEYSQGVARCHISHRSIDGRTIDTCGGGSHNRSGISGLVTITESLYHVFVASQGLV